LALLLSAMFGISNRRTARRALTLSERQEARRDSRLDLYLFASMDHRDAESQDRILTFHVRVGNPTDRPTAIVQAELHVTYEVEGVLTTIKVRHGATEPTASAESGLDRLELPLRLEANDAHVGWLSFGLSADLMRGREIDRYDVVVRDVQGIEESTQVRILGEVVDG
jgi:hypothetical protein